MGITATNAFDLSDLANQPDTPQQYGVVSEDGEYVQLYGRRIDGYRMKIESGDNDLIKHCKGMAKILMREFHFAVSEEGVLYVYNGKGVYVKTGSEFVKEAISNYLTARGEEKAIKPRFLKDVSDMVTLHAIPMPSVPSIRYINLLNGIYDTKESKLIKHTHKLITPIQFPIKYNPSATCEKWDKFFSEIFPDDTQIAPWEIIAWFMIPYTNIKKMVLLLGEGNNGKSLFIHLIQSIIGQNNYSQTPLEDLVTDKFAVSTLYGKLLNICDEINNSKLKATDKIKALTGGGGSIEAERKYGNRFIFTPFARHMYSANALPPSSDNTHGFYSRFCILPFPNQFKNNPGLATKLKHALTHEDQLSGVFNKAMLFLNKVKTMGITETPSMYDAIDRYQATSDTTLQFIRESLYVSQGSILQFQTLYDVYKVWCSNRNITPVSNVSMGKALAKYRPEYELKRTRMGVRNFHHLSIRVEQPRVSKTAKDGSRQTGGKADVIEIDKTA